MAKVQLKLAKRYARALFELVPPGELDQTVQALKDLRAAWLEQASLQAALLNPALPHGDRLALIEALTDRALPGNVTLKNFGSLLFENRRLSLLPEIARVFAEMLAEMKKLLALEVVSAFELSDAEKQNFSAKIKQDYGSLASVNWSIDPTIIGGLQVKSGDRLLDGSVRGALDRIRTQLTA